MGDERSTEAAIVHGGGPQVPEGAPLSPAAPRGRRRASRLLTHRATLTTVDQGLASASNFVVGVVVARVSGPRGLGAFAVVYAAWLVVASLHRSLITDPMTIDGDARGEAATQKLGAGLVAETTFGVASACVVLAFGLVLLAVGTRAYGIALLALAPWIPFLLVQDYWRWTGFMEREPRKSLANDAVFNCVQGFGLLVIVLVGLRSPTAVIAAWGAGAAAGALFGLRQFAVELTSRGGLSFHRSRWNFSKWLVARNMLGVGTAQSYTVLAAGILGPVNLGGLRAAQSLVSGPSMVLIQAGGSIGLPEASHAFAETGWPGLRHVSRWVTALGALSVGLVGMVVLFAGPTLLGVLYGPEFTRFATVANIVALSMLVHAFSLGAILVLKLTKRTQAWVFEGLITFVVSSAAVIVFSLEWGVTGAAVSMVVASVTTLVGHLYLARRASRALRDRSETR